MPTSNNLINKSLQALRALIDETVKDLHELTIQIRHDQLAGIVSDLRNRLNDPFMFVIVGEVKAGKSSFINALLESREEITAVAPQPMTDTIQQIVYGPEKQILTINPYLKRIEIPVEILREIALVDTPGTNTIIEHHQEITESFIPASDLIVFVFEAKNPYRESAWQFFQFIHEDWRKKVIFVLQQKDLMPAEDLEINLAKLREYAEKKGVHEPAIFSVSAKEELDGHTEQSGFAQVRAYIRENITGGKAPVMKLQNSVHTARHILTSIKEGLILRRKQWAADCDFRQEITDSLVSQETKSYRQVDVLVENIVAGYDRATRSAEAELSNGMSFFSLLYRSVASVFSRKASAQEWLDHLARSLEEELSAELRTKLMDGIGDLSDSVQQMAKLIDLKIRTSQTILQNNHEIFSAIAEKRSHVFKDLQDTFDDFIKKSENFTGHELFPDKSPLPGSFATGSGLAVVGIVLAALAQGMVFDLTGGILTTIGLIFAGAATSGKRRKILGGFRDEITKGRMRLEEDVTRKLKLYIKNLKERIDSHFDPFDLLLEKEGAQLDLLEKKQAEVQHRLDHLDQELARQLTH
ncbi:MAG: GTPase Era [Haliscomenobacter sp.]|jgi:GTPase Era involved in 16S rRNA processing|nr:GTPase Era [Haliscomenobacter sp.]